MSTVVETPISFTVKDIDGVTVPAIVENINFRTNDINTAKLKTFLSLEEAVGFVVGLPLKIYAKGQKYENSILNRTPSQLVNLGNKANYDKLIFHGKISLIRTTGYLNQTTRDFEYEIFLNGIEDELLNYDGFNYYFFFDETAEQIIKMAGSPDFTKATRHLDPYIHAFVTDGLGRYWTKLDVRNYFNLNVLNCLSIPNAITFDVLSNLRWTGNLETLNFREMLNLLCGNTFNWCVSYFGDEFNINIIFNYENNTLYTPLSFTAFQHFSRQDFETVETPAKVVLSYPFLMELDGVFPIKPHPDNTQGIDLYTLTQEEETIAKAPRRYVKDWDYYDGTQTDPLPVPYPPLVDYYLKNSIGARMGAYTKFIINPIILYDNTYFNLEDFEIVDLKGVFRVKNGVEQRWITTLPAKPFTVSIDGSVLKFDCEIPHQFAPTGYNNYYSMMEIPTFPIDTGDSMRIIATLISNKVKRVKYRGSVNAKPQIFNLDYPISDAEADTILDYIYYLTTKTRRVINFTLELVDYFIEFVTMCGYYIDNLYYTRNSEDQSMPINSVISGITITRKVGGTYQLNLQTAVNTGYGELLNLFLFRSEQKNIPRKNSIEYDTDVSEFYSTINTIYENNYATNMGDYRRYVARINEHKGAYWLNVHPENITFERIEKEGGGYEVSRRIEVITREGVEERIENKIVPAEVEFPAIKSKWDCGNVPVLIGAGATLRFVKFIDTNTEGRSFAEIME
jgi:hypothetical protein